jgi:hypothetical protein
LGSRELPAVEFFECNGFVFCFCFSFAAATSAAETILYVISGGLECSRKEKNIHVCPLHTELQQLQGWALATQCLHRSACVVSKGFEPSREERTVMYHGHRRGHGGIGGQEACFLAVLRRSGHGFLQRSENAEVRKQNRSDGDDVH